MTEKRFTEIISTQKVIDNQTGKKYNCLIDDGLLELLNELHETNEQLRKDATTLIQSNQDYRKENESLKEENKFLRNKVSTYKSGNALLKKRLDKEWK